MDESLLNEEIPVAIKGTVLRILFAAEDGGYGVVKVTPNTRDKRPVTIVGELSGLQEGETIEVTGRWTEHPKWGPQIRVDTVRTTAPGDLNGIKSFLSSQLPGIGEKKAELIVAKWGDESLDVIEKSPKKLLEIPGISEKMLPAIENAWDDIREIRKLSLFLHDLGLGTPGLTNRIFKAWGRGAVDKIKHNCYLLVEIPHIGFITADKIGQAMGIEKESHYRLVAGLLHTLQSAEEDGHTYLPKNELVEKACKMMDVNYDLVDETATRLEGHSKVVIEEENYYWKSLHRAEAETAQKIVAISGTTGKAGKQKDKLVSGLEKTVLDDHQKLAIRKGMEKGIVCVTGGPGTGKTRTIQEMVNQARLLNLTIELAAPTGRAAQRMSEGVHLEGKTIHRLLGYKPSDNTFTRNEKNPLTCDILVIDEMSMLDTWLARRLFDAIKPTTHVFLVGDADQLPSVGPGRVFSEIIDAKLPCERFDKIYRTGEGSDVAFGSAMINQGKMPKMTKPGESDFFFIEIEDANRVTGSIVRYATERLEDLYGIQSSDVQVLAPMYKGVTGIENLNTKLQEVVNPHGSELVKGKGIKIGDRVMQVVNNYKLEGSDGSEGVFNGDIGKVVDANTDEKMLYVNFGDRTVEYKGTDLDGLVLAYAISIHKSQGSEFPGVIIPLLTSHYIFLQRSLLYTAVSRAKRVTGIIGTRKALWIALKKIESRTRYTSLAEKIQWEKMNPTLPGMEPVKLF